MLVTRPASSADRLLRRIAQYAQEAWFLTTHVFTDVFRRPYYGREYILQMNDVGVSSLPVIGLTGLVTGMVLALQSHISLQPFGGTSLLPNAITATLVRELGPIMGSLMVAGRVGAGITSQIGAMRVTSQIDAMLALGTDPIKKLVVPRIVALTFMLPLLIAIVCFLGIFGGWLLAKFALSFPTPFFWAGVVENLRFVDILSCLVKAAVFGYVISLFACVEGLRTQGGTNGVGQATTRAVVIASLGVIVSDFFLTKIFYTFLI
jgi:phospholipid/cholesterol/gamma-HCH transport system permease protein